MTQNDLLSVGQWSAAMRSSSDIWRKFVNGLDSFFDVFGFGIEKILREMRNPSPYAIPDRRVLRRETLSSYLSYANANLILSNEMGAGLHDWEDFQPFYHQKFLAVGCDDAGLSAVGEASHQLFLESVLSYRESELSLMQSGRPNLLMRAELGIRFGLPTGETLAEALYSRLRGRDLGAVHFLNGH